MTLREVEDFSRHKRAGTRYNKQAEPVLTHRPGPNQSATYKEVSVVAKQNLFPGKRTVKQFQEDAVYRTGKFKVDDRGRIWRGNKRAERHTGTYLQVQVIHLGKRCITAAHRLVWRFLKGPIPSGLQVNHKNGIKDDNRPENLELVTPSENRKHAFRVGLSDQFGERHPSWRLTNKQIAEIRNAYASGGFRQVDLAERYGVSRPHISLIISGKKRPKQNGALSQGDNRYIACDRDHSGRFTKGSINERNT